MRNPLPHQRYVQVRATRVRLLSATATSNCKALLAASSLHTTFEIRAEAVDAYSPTGGRPSTQASAGRSRVAKRGRSGRWWEDFS